MLRIDNLDSMPIPAFTEHADTGRYPYPVEREKENPFEEAELLFKAQTVEATLLSRKFSRNLDLFLGWLLLQHLTNPQAKKQVPSFQPEIEVTRTARVQIVAYKKTFNIEPQLTADSMLQDCTQEWLMSIPQIRTYLDVLKTKQVQTLEPGDRQFHTTRIIESYPVGTQLILKPATCKTDYWGEVKRICRVEPIGYQLDWEKWDNAISWSEPFQTPDSQLPFGEQLAQLSLLPPVPKTIDALNQVLRRIGKIPTPSTLPEFIQLAKQLREWYSCFWGEEFSKANNLFLPIQTNNRWHLSSLRPEELFQKYCVIVGLAGLPTAEGTLLKTMQTTPEFLPSLRILLSGEEGKSLPGTECLHAQWEELASKVSAIPAT